MSRKIENWIDDFAKYTSMRPTPEVFLRWAAFGAIAAALQRRVYVTISDMKLYANPFIILVGRPGGGKSVAVNSAKEFTHDRRVRDYIRTAADSTTRESFFQQMEKAYNVKLKNPPKDAVALLDAKHSSLSVLSSELGTLLSSKNMDFLRALADLYDADRPGDVFSYVVKQAESTHIQKPWLQILGGTTPDDLGEILPRAAMGQGFTSRLILVWSDEEYDTNDLFQQRRGDTALRARLLDDYEQMLSMDGEYSFTADAAEYLNEWYRNRNNHKPTDPLLKNYCSRRLVHLVKLSLISAAAVRQELIIKQPDIEYAWKMLREAEKDMGKCLKGIGLNPLGDQMQHIIEFVVNEYSRTKKPVKERIVREFVSRNVPIDKAFHYLRELDNYCHASGEAPNRAYSPKREVES